MRHHTGIKRNVQILATMVFVEAGSTVRGNGFANVLEFSDRELLLESWRCEEVTASRPV